MPTFSQTLQAFNTPQLQQYIISTITPFNCCFVALKEWLLSFLFKI